MDIKPVALVSDDAKGAVVFYTRDAGTDCIEVSVSQDGVRVAWWGHPHDAKPNRTVTLPLERIVAEANAEIDAGWTGENGDEMDYDTWKTGGAYARNCNGCGQRLTELDAYYGCDSCDSWESDAHDAARRFFADVWLADDTDYWGRTPGQDDPADCFDTLTEGDFEVGASWGFRSEFPDPEDAAVAWIARRLIWDEDCERRMLAVAAVAEAKAEPCSST